MQTLAYPMAGCRLGEWVARGGAILRHLPRCPYNGKKDDNDKKRPCAGIFGPADEITLLSLANAKDC